MIPPHSPLHEDSDEPVKVPGPALNDKRWTLGDSRSIVAGSTPESLGTTVAWLAVPTVLFGIFATLLLMAI